MAHKILENGNVVVDWTTGDPEGDRKVLLSAYRDFIIEINILLNQNKSTAENCEGILSDIESVFKKWNISTDNQVDEFPRIWIKRPE